MTSEEGSLGGLIRHVIPEFLYGDIVSSKANSQIGSDHSVCSREAVYRFGGGEDRWSFYRDVERQAVHFIEHGQKMSARISPGLANFRYKP
ncbi:MAG: hypothetical protein EOP45_11220 [Sphingobacteriaceae bacterium]|nr:MAG: hypothetical protein EOP45_11220 [Sphingobacteriaceae bacterium]